MDRNQDTRKKDAAKFFSGVAANQVLTHAALAVNDVEFTLFGLEYTPQFNAAAAAGWALVLLFLIHYAWLKADGHIPSVR